MFFSAAWTFWWKFKSLVGSICLCKAALGATGVDTSTLAAKFDLASLKVELDKLDIDNLKTVFIDVNSLSNVVDNDVVNKLCMITKVNTMNTKVQSTSVLVCKTQHDSSKQNFERKVEDFDKEIPNTSGLGKKTDCNIKIL